MKKLAFLLGLFLILTTFKVSAQNSDSQWSFKNDHKMELNYNLLGRSTVQGVWYGAGGYALGMWLSENDYKWGFISSLLAVNIPLLLEKRMDEPESVIGRNVGALSISAGFTIGIEMNRRSKLSFELPTWMRRNR